MGISTRLESAFKIALAIVLAYGIALWMDWEKPYWAGIAIATCSLATFGESINKGLLRLGGTAVAIVVALTLISVFPQERWLFIGTLGAWVAFCTFMMTGTSRFYFWQVAGFVVPVLAVSGGVSPVSDFDTVVLRAQQTVLGVLCFSVVYALWPGGSRQTLEQTLRECLGLERRLIASSLRRLQGDDDSEDLAALRLQAARELVRLRATLDAAVMDSFDVWDRRAGWRRAIARLSELNAELQRLRLGLGDLAAGQQTAAAAALRAALAETDVRLSDVEALLTGDAPRGEEISTAPADATTSGQALPHFERAALSVAARHAGRALDLAGTLKAEMAGLRDLAEPPTYTAVPAASTRHLLDPDRWLALLRVQVVYLAAVACIFYVPGFPAPPMLFTLSVSIPLGLALMPQASIMPLAIPIIGSAVFAGILHILVLPVLEGFSQLALLLFASTFLVSYLFWRPEQRLLRLIALDVLVMGLQIDNATQNFSFLFFAFLVIGLLVILAITELTRYLPVSFRPERRVEAMIERFFASCEHVIRHSPGIGSPEPGPIGRWLLRHHLAELRTIPRKLGPWLQAIPQDARSAAPPGDVTHIAASLEALGNRVDDFVEARRLSQAEPLLAGGGDATRRWRLAVADVTSGLVEDPGAAETADLEARLSRGIAKLEETVERVLNEMPDDALEPKDFENMYRLLGAYRGLAEGVIEYARRATAIDWPRLRESRF